MSWAKLLGIKWFDRDNYGQSVMEYVLLIAAVITAILAVRTVVHEKVKSNYSSIAGKLDDAISKINV